MGHGGILSQLLHTSFALMFCGSGMWVLPESPAWLIEKGYTVDADRALERINGNKRCSIRDDNRSRDEGLSSLAGWASSDHGSALSTFRRRSRNTNCEPYLPGKSEIERIDSKSPLKDNEVGPEDTSPPIFGSKNSVGGKGSLHTLGEEPVDLVRHSKPNTQGFVSSKFNKVRTKIKAAKLTMSQYRRQVYIALFLAVAQQFCGQTNILSYAPLIFADAMQRDFGDDDNANDGNNNTGETKDVSMIIIGSVKFFVTVLVIWRIEYIGRRFLLIFGNTLIAVGLLALVVAFGGSSNNFSADGEAGINATSWSPLTNIKTFHLALPGVLFVVSGYSMSFGPLTWLLTSEMFPTDIRGRALGYSTIISYTCGALSTETFLYAQSILGPSFVFGIYCVFTVSSALFAYLAIPDTGAKNVEQIDELLSRMYWWKYSVIAISQNDENGADDGPASSSSEMVRQLSVHSLT